MIIRLKKIIYIFAGLLFLFLLSYIRWPWRMKEDSLDTNTPPYIEYFDSEGEFFEIPIVYVGQTKAAMEEYFGYSEESLRSQSLWWQIRDEEEMSQLAKRLALGRLDAEFDYDKYYYIVAYGKPLVALYCYTGEKYVDGGFSANVQYDTEVDYKSGIVYVYEMDKQNILVDTEWLRKIFTNRDYGLVENMRNKGK